MKKVKRSLGVQMVNYFCNGTLHYLRLKLLPMAFSKVSIEKQSLWKYFNPHLGQCAHTQCRKEFTDLKRISNDKREKHSKGHKLFFFALNMQKKTTHSSILKRINFSVVKLSSVRRKCDIDNDIVPVWTGGFQFLNMY